MKFNVSSGMLNKQTQKIVGIVGSNNIQPIIVNFLFSLKGNKLSITTTDMETTMVTYVDVQGSKDGDICISAKTLSEYLKAVPESPISFEVGENFEVIIKNHSGKQKMIGEDSTLFPTMVEENETETFTISSNNLISGLSKCVKVCDQDIRQWSTGVNIKIRNGNIDIAATDASKLILIKHKVESDVNSNFIIPQKSVHQITKNIPATETPLSIKFSKDYLFIQTDEVKIVSRLIDSNFPDYTLVIPKNNENILTVSKIDFINSLRIASVFSNKTVPVIVLQTDKNELTITSQDVDFGTMGTEKIGCEYKGEKIRIGFNSKGLNDLCSNIDGEKIVLKLKNKSTGAIIVDGNDVEGNEELYLIMPLMTEQ